MIRKQSLPLPRSSSFWDRFLIIPFKVRGFSKRAIPPLNWCKDIWIFKFNKHTQRFEEFPFLIRELQVKRDNYYFKNSQIKILSRYVNIINVNKHACKVLHNSYIYIEWRSCTCKLLWWIWMKQKQYVFSIGGVVEGRGLMSTLFIIKCTVIFFFSTFNDKWFSSAV